MALFNPKGEKEKSDYPCKHPVDGYGKKMLPGYGQEPLLEPYREQRHFVENKRSKISER